MLKTKAYVLDYAKQQAGVLARRQRDAVVAPTDADDALLERYFADGMADVCQRTEHAEGSFDLAVTVGTSAYVLPQSVDTIQQATFGGSTVQHAPLSDVVSNTSEGVPALYAVEGRTLHITPAPDVAAIFRTIPPPTAGAIVTNNATGKQYFVPFGSDERQNVIPTTYETLTSFDVSANEGDQLRVEMETTGREDPVGKLPIRHTHSGAFDDDAPPDPGMPSSSDLLSLLPRPLRTALARYVVSLWYADTGELQLAATPQQQYERAIQQTSTKANRLTSVQRPYRGFGL